MSSVALNKGKVSHSDRWRSKERKTLQASIFGMKGTPLPCCSTLSHFLTTHKKCLHVKPHRNRITAGFITALADF